ncbi:MAG: hypothetical protein U5L10_00960 [Candidatus Moranbacteria bacterium]|nr:hypothetical protein [Candidatus Moranbacteria bacterium]
MQIKIPQDDYKYLWTRHVVGKIFQYGITPNRVKRIINNPQRREEGIAPSTVAVMQKKSKKEDKGELWVMYQTVGGKKRVISTWVYPGVTPKGKEIFVPDEVWMEIEKYKKN